MNDPLGLFGDEQNDDPLGLFGDTPKKKQAGFNVAFKKALAGAGNAIESAISLPAGALASYVGFQEQGDEIFRQMEANRAARAKWANPENLETSLGQDIGAMALTLPAQLPAMAGQAAEKGLDLIQRGEPLSTAIPATAGDALLNAVSMGPMAPAKTFLGRAAIGTASNVSFGASSDAATQLLATKEDTKKAYDPYDARRRTQDALIGGVTQGVFGERPKAKGKPSPIDAIRAEAPKPVAPMPDVEPEQLRLFDQFEERSPISKYQTEMAPDMWRVDENGIPIRADLSMEVQNLQQPLQRNLWGDELEANFPRDPNKPLDMETGDIPGVERFSEPVNFRNDPENQIPLTEAIDSMDPAARTAALEQTQMGRELPASPELEVARAQAENTLFNKKEFDSYQKREQENARAFDEASAQKARGEQLKRAAEAADGPQPKGFNKAFRKQRGGLLIDGRQVTIEPTATGFVAKLGKKIVGYLNSNITPEQRAMLGEDASVDMVKVDPELKGKGIGHALYEAWSKANEGNVIPSGKTSQAAWNTWKKALPGGVDKFVNQEAQRIFGGADPQQVLGNIPDPEVAQRVQARAALLKKHGGGVLVNFEKKKQTTTLADIEAIQKQIDEVGRRYVAGEISHEQMMESNRELIYKKQDMERLELRRKESIGAGEVTEIFPGYKIIPPGTKVMAKNGLSYPEPTRGEVVGTHQFRYGEKAYNLPVVDFGDGRPRKILPGDITEVFDGPKSPFNFKKQGGGLKIDWGKEASDMEAALIKSADGSFIPENPDTSLALETARGESDGKLWTYAQSGAVNAAMKTGSTLIKTVGNLVQAAGKRADLATRKYVLPAEKALRKLSREELTQLGDVFKDEMFQDYRYDGDLLAKHLTVKQLEAYTKMRDVFDATLSAQNEARVAKGQQPITAKEAYLSSRWQGDFRVPVYELLYNSDGSPKIDPKTKEQAKKLVWYLADTTQRGVDKQLKALLAKEPTLKAGKPHVVRSLKGGADIQSMYSTMLDILGRDDPAVQRIKELVEMDVGDDAANMLAQEKHFKSKSGVRGFAGDRPGFHKTRDTIKMFEQQVQYAKNAFQWAEMQKNADDLKMLLSDEELANKQPNNMKFAREYVKNALGQGEGKLAKAFDDTVREMGVSPSVLDKAVGGMKSFFITQKLAVSAGYTLANLVQTTNMVPYLANLSSQGYHANAAKAMAIGYTGALPMALAHYMRAAGGGEYKTFFGDMPNKFMEGALKYAEDNGITSRSIYDEAPVGTGFNPLKKVERAASFTISAPETVVRSAAFLTYAYYLKDSGKFKDMQAVFQKAEDMVNMSMVDYRATEKPLMFSKGGTLGNIANTLQTYPMSFYNQYKYMLNEALQGRPGGLATMMVMQGAIAGAAGMPYFEDLTNLYKLMRDNLLSDAQWAKAMKHPFFSDPKLWMLENLGESSVYGALSTQMGLGLTSRVTAPSLEAMSQAPFGPAVDLSKQVMNLGKAALDPTNTSKVGQAAMGSIPTGLQGWLETQPFMKDITFVENADGTKTFMKTSDLADRKGGYTRTEDEVNIRKWGLRSQQEVLSRDVNWAAQQANMTTKEKTTGLVEKIYDAARQGNAAKVEELRKLLIDLTGKDISSEQLQNQLLEEQMDDVSRNVRNSKSPQQMLNTARSLRLLEGE